MRFVARLRTAIGANCNPEVNIKRAKERLAELFEGSIAFSETVETGSIGMGGERFLTRKCH